MSRIGKACIAALFASAAFLAGCERRDAPTPAPVVPVTAAAATKNRFTAVYWQTVAIGTDIYYPNRAVLILRDEETGVEYLLVQGMGTGQLVTTREGPPKSRHTVVREH